MLVLSRLRDESIQIGDDIKIEVVDIRGDKVRIGITAPAHVPVHRQEVYDALQREKRAAENAKLNDLPEGGSAEAMGEKKLPRCQVPWCGTGGDCCLDCFQGRTAKDGA